MKNDLPYFSHDNNARNHPKMKALIAEYGYEGYGRFWALNERIAESSGACIDISRKVNKLDLAKELGLDGNGLDRFLAFLSDPEIDLINMVDGKITTDRINELHSKVNSKRKKQRKDEEIGGENTEINGENEEIGGENTEINGENEEIGGDFDTDKIRLDKNRQDKNRQDSSGSAEPPDKIPASKLKPDKPKKPPLRGSEPENGMERVKTADPPSFPTACAVDHEIIPVSQSPPKKSRSLELSPEQMALFHAAKACFEASEKSRAMMYQDRGTTAREMKHLKTLVVRCANMAPGITADFLRNVLEHFRVMTNGKLKGRAAFTPRALITPWIWELVIDSLPESGVTPGLRESIRGMFK